MSISTYISHLLSSKVSPKSYHPGSNDITSVLMMTDLLKSFSLGKLEPRCEKTGILHMRIQRRRSALTSVFVFATRIVLSLYFLNPKFQTPNHLLWLYSPVCVGPGRKPRKPVFSQRGSLIIRYHGTGDRSFNVL